MKRSELKPEHFDTITKDRINGCNGCYFNDSEECDANDFGLPICYGIIFALKPEITIDDETT